MGNNKRRKLNDNNDDNCSNNSRRTVQFAADAVHHHHTHYYHPEEEDEISYNAWYNDNDYDNFKNECRASLFELNAVHGDYDKFDHTKFCLRGLEEQTSIEIYQARRLNKQNFIDSILREQRLHKKLGISEPTKLKMISVVLSKSSKEWS